MSLFQPIETLHENANQADVFHLGPHGCSVMFTSYEKDTHTGTLINITNAKNRLISGSICLTLNGKHQLIHAGEWYNVPANIEHTLHYLSDCSVIEFWFDQN
ncbi:hypothetical protein A9Q99_07840 [Gammaproteobacteria bacterium 45_16_T64]|nr:hypothetical protein A9Q99_07840 [Gammaproteobacteria bacterium 45_16_T64]